MKGSKTTQTTQQSSSGTNSYGWQTPPSTPDVDAMRNFNFTIDPRIGYAFASAKNAMNNSFNNPLGGQYTQHQKDAIMRAQAGALGQQEAQTRAESYHDLQGQQFGQKAAVAGLTSPRLVQTGYSGTGSSTGTAQQQPDIFGSMLGGLSTGLMM